MLTRRCWFLSGKRCDTRPLAEWRFDVLCILFGHATLYVTISCLEISYSFFVERHSLVLTFVAHPSQGRRVCFERWAYFRSIFDAIRDWNTRQISFSELCTVIKCSSEILSIVLVLIMHEHRWIIIGSVINHAYSNIGHVLSLPSIIVIPCSDCRWKHRIWLSLCARKIWTSICFWWIRTTESVFLQGLCDLEIF